MQITLRLEQQQDFRRVEELTREAFWDVHCPGCDEHYLAHILRDYEGFIPELDYVAEISEESGAEPVLAGNIMYCEAYIEADHGDRYPVLTFGPISVLPLYQRMGIGSTLIKHSKEIAKELGHKLIVIYGDPDYYQRFGFVAAENYGIKGKDGYFSPALQICELQSNTLQGISGKFHEGKIYEPNPKAAAEFDRSFPAREKGFKPSQLRFQDLLAQSHL